MGLALSRTWYIICTFPLGNAMRFSVLSALVVAAQIGALGLTAEAATTTGAQKATAKRTTSHKVAYAKTRRGRRAFLVPPPPAYIPSYLPEMYAHHSTATPKVAVVKKENPYKKYIQTPAGDAPEPVATRKGVVTWVNRT